MKKYKGIIMFLSYFILMIGGGAFLLSRYPEPSQTDTILKGQLVIQAGLMIIAFKLYHKHLASEWRRFRQENPSIGPVLRKMGLAFLGIIFLRVITMIVLTIFMDIESLAQNQQALNEMSKQMPVWGISFMTVIFAPVVEELTFREAILGNLAGKRRSLVILATLFSIILFTALHSMVWADFLIYLPLALTLTYFYYYYNRNVVGSMIFHYLNNLAALVMMLTLVQNP